MAMFKRVLESISRSFGGGKPTAPVAAPPPAKPAPAPPPPAATAVAAAPAPARAPEKAPAAAAAPVQQPPSKSGGRAEKQAAASKAPAQKKPARNPEEMCGITPKMSKEQIGAQLKLLYRRYNRGASSLDPKVREEADQMMDAIVAVRDKTFGEI
jgi:hypothetical protein